MTDDLDHILQPAHASTADLLRRLIRENVRRYMGWIAMAGVCMAMLAGMTAIITFLMEPVVNHIFVNRNAEMLLPVGTAVVAAFVIKGLSAYGQAFLMSKVGLRIVADNQRRLFAHLVGMDASFFSRVATGSLLSRFLIDINLMRNAVSNVLTSLGKDLLTLIGLLTVMFVQSWELSLIAVVVFPIALLPIVKLGRRMRKVTANTQHEQGLLTTLLNQTFQGIRIVKAYGMQAYEGERVTRLVERINDLNLKAASTRALASPFMETLGGLAAASVIFYGGYQVIGDRLDPGSFFSFLFALLSAYEPMKRLANLNSQLQEGLAGAQRLFALLDTEPAIKDKPGARPLGDVAGAIRLEDVHFSYETGKPALLGVDLEVPAGRTVALVGPSGAGKTTILNLIPRFFDVTGGRVTIDGHDVRDVTFASIMEKVALVSQEVTLFDDSVAANIGYGRAGASREEIEQAARNAAAHDFITQLEDGYETVVGERGIKLSGGQRQRLAIARAMLKNAPILLLDEATSALDTESERQVQAALEALMQGRTTLVIAHRLSTVIGAGKICVVEGGRIVEQGTHAELLADGGQYKRLYDLQFAGEDAADAVPARAAGS